MSLRHKAVPRILAIDPSTRGFGFVVLEGATNLIDWGVKATRKDKNERGLIKVGALLRLYRPDVIVAERHSGKGSRRCHRVAQLIAAMEALAKRDGVRFCRFSRGDIRKVFASFNATTKHEIAHAIARQLPELAPHLPRYRKPWMSEDYRMAIFDAASLALTFLYSRSFSGR